MADKVRPGDLLNTTKLVATGLMSRSVSKENGRIQVIICERLILPLVVDEELRRGLADLATPGPSEYAGQKAAQTWLLKLLGIEPL
jgi:hypothetical protein